eukprot:SAG31_NODE_3428_length_4289_cov_3.615990_3_plen_440_part_00
MQFATLLLPVVAAVPLQGVQEASGSNILVQEIAAGSPGGGGGGGGGGNQSHLYFYWVNKAANQCGDVDAAPFMPKDLFEPSHKLQLLEYVQATISLFGIKYGPQPGDLKLGRCKDHGFTVDAHQEIGSTWTPMDLQGPICMKHCKCQWWDTHGSPVSGYKPAAGLHKCTDVPDDPATGHFCSLCGPSAPGNCGGERGACSIGIAIWRPYIIFLSTFDVRAASVFAAFSSRVRLPVVFFSLLTRRLCGPQGHPNTTQKWGATNDPVMGGISESSVKIVNAPNSEIIALDWSGEVKVVPKLHAPGFCTATTGGYHQQPDKFPDISETEGLLIRAQNPMQGGLSSFKVSMTTSVRSGEREGEFEGRFNTTVKVEGRFNTYWRTYFVPFSAMSQNFRGQPEGGAPTRAQLKAITGLGFNQDGVAGKFNILIVEIAAGSRPAGN